MKFLIDMHLTPELVGHLGSLGHDAVHVSAVGMAEATDTEILERARAEGRIVVTADLDYPRLLAQSRASDPGLVLVRGGHYTNAQMRGLVDRLLGFSRELPLEATITVIDQRRIRRRRLPIEPLADDPKA